MGGCRCTYRNCTVRSDGVIHMFHYPVFEKIRCHQWLVNANKLEFLNLKVSQLKNRVVCQNHFKDNDFMNYKKGKLKFNAIPTENGPFCDSTEEAPTTFSICLDDIENDLLLFSEKKANFSVRYGDFLTNSEMMEFDTVNQANEVCTTDNIKYKAEESNYIEPNTYNINDNTLKPEHEIINSSQNQTVDLSTFYTNGQTKPTLVEILFEDIPTNENKLQNSSDILAINQSNQLTKEVKNPESRVKILSEKKISQPIPFTGKFEPLSPSLVLHMPNKKKKNNIGVVYMKSEDNETSVINQQERNQNILITTENKMYEPEIEESKLEQPIPVAIQLPDNETILKSNEINTKLINNKRQSPNKSSVQKVKVEPLSAIETKHSIKNVPNFNNETQNLSLSPKISLLRSRMPPERLAAIEEKRKYNMKLRDIIESCLSKLDDQEKVNDDIRLSSNILVKSNSNSKNKKLEMPKQPQLPSEQEFSLAFLEDRIKRMESNLLSKIDQNSQNILNLKKSFSPESINKTTCTQTSNNDEAHKKYLYLEISKYLSPEANSLVYEELFINKYAQRAPKGPSTAKRRRCR